MRLHGYGWRDLPETSDCSGYPIMIARSWEQQLDELRDCKTGGGYVALDYRG